MKYLAEYRDAELVHSTIAKIKETVSQPWTLMEICGGQTHSIIKNGLDQLLPDEIELVHGPGCPVCVTPLELIDKALAIASQPDVIFTSYGDMLRVPGSQADLFSIRAQGGDVRVVYSPLDALKIAQENPNKEVVFFAIGFETTAPANVMSILQAEQLKVSNYSILVSHVRVPPAIETILGSPNNRVQGFLAAGHVCAVMGYWEYLPIAKKYQIPISVTGFEPLDIVQGILDTVESLEAGESPVKNSYIRAVTEQGNKAAQQSINRVFESCDRKWRGIGLIPNSGWRLNSAYADFDAEQRFNVQAIEAEESPLCISGLVLQGIKKPAECEAFGNLCTPENPLGATMVSDEGACAAYYRYRNQPAENARDIK
ncbi:MAG: hydrogenase formation protein HypD [Anaerolineales bacterium]|nr:hydrogenase formation protein HypD [Anaerolineales bacterium]